MGIGVYLWRAQSYEEVTLGNELGEAVVAEEDKEVVENLGPVSDEPSIDPPDSEASVAKVEEVGSEPQRLMDELANLIERGAIDELRGLAADGVGISNDLSRLMALTREQNFKLARDHKAIEVGEIERNRRVRWALPFTDEDTRTVRVEFDLVVGEDGIWRLESIEVPDSEQEAQGAGMVVELDALGVVDRFIMAAQNLEYGKARSFVDRRGVNDAMIAGVLILFEEGAYRMRQESPVRNLYQRDGNAGFVVKIESMDRGQAGDIGVTLRQTETGGWLITRLALDNLLRDYAGRLADGDIYYTPLVTNPQGGSSIALYFGFDNAEISARSRRQLEIIAQIVKLDEQREIVLSGHTDAVGDDQYNFSLSERRAAAVKQVLIENGVEADQIKLEALGPSQPRRPNFLEDGSADESGQRANRRAEVYLDF